MIAYAVDAAAGSAAEHTIWSLMNATLYSKDSCSFCIRAKMLLEQNGVDYEYVDLTGNIDEQVELAKRTGRMTMPLVFVGDELIGGFEDLVLALRNPRIREALAVK
jgi:glutaredoxin 3